MRPEVVGTLAFVAVREQQRHVGVLAPLGLAGGDGLVDDRLRAVDEVAELGLPQVNEIFPPRVRRSWLLMTSRLSASSFAGTARTDVAVGTSHDASMFFTTADAAPRSGVDLPLLGHGVRTLRPWRRYRRRAGWEWRRAHASRRRQWSPPLPPSSRPGNRRTTEPGWSDGRLLPRSPDGNGLVVGEEIVPRRVDRGRVVRGTAGTSPRRAEVQARRLQWRWGVVGGHGTTA